MVRQIFCIYAKKLHKTDFFQIHFIIEYNLCSVIKRLFNNKKRGIMKKIVLTVIVVILTLSVACAGNDRPISVEQLPQKAQQFLKSYYPKVGVAYAKEDVEVMSKEYEVVLTDGSKMEFAADGEWKSVECKHNAVPMDIVPQQIKSYVEKNYPEVLITKIDRDRYEYEVSLSNRLELTFNKEFKLIEIDD